MRSSWWETTLRSRHKNFEAGGDRGCKNGFRGDGNSDGDGCAAQKGVYLSPCAGCTVGYIKGLRKREKHGRTNYQNRIFGAYAEIVY